MDLRKLKTLIDLVSDSNVSELEITEPEGKVRIVKSMGAVYMPAQNMGQPMMHMPVGAPTAPATATAAVASDAAALAPAVPDTHTITSPMVGTFYQCATPGSPPLVSVGDEVKLGQTVCIIEAMKIMNEIEADRSGRVARVLVENGKPVEYGQALFIIE